MTRPTLIRFAAASILTLVQLSIPEALHGSVVHPGH